MKFFTMSDTDSGREERQAAFASLLPELAEEDLFHLERQIRLRLWHGRCLRLRKLPAAIKLGLLYSFLSFLVIVVIPLPAGPPLFVPLLIAATGCVAVTLVAIYDLALGLILVRLRPQVPAFEPVVTTNGSADPAFLETISSAQGT